MGIKSGFSSFKKGFTNIFKCSGDFKKKSVKKGKSKFMVPQTDIEAMAGNRVLNFEALAHFSQQAAAPLTSNTSEPQTLFEQFDERYRPTIHYLEMTLNRTLLSATSCPDHEFVDTMKPIMDLLFALSVRITCASDLIHIGGGNDLRQLQPVIDFIDNIKSGGQIS